MRFCVCVVACPAKRVSWNQKGAFLPSKRRRRCALPELRERGEPLGYVLGISPFFGEDFLVRVDKDRTLIPRSDTEILVQALIDRLHPGDYFLDLCCGSGCVALAAIKK